MTDFGEAPVCMICGQVADETSEYTTALTCSCWGCGKHDAKLLYHTECVGEYQRSNSIFKGSNTGYLCPRGNAKAEIDKDNPCRGRIQATHHRLPGKKRKQPPASLPAAMFPSRRPQALKQPKPPKPQSQGPPPKAPKPISQEQIQRQVQACRQATQATQGDSVLERLRGGPVQPAGIIPGMDFEDKKKKPKKKSKASKSNTQAAANGGSVPESAYLKQLPYLVPNANGDQKYITDVKRYNMLTGHIYSSEEEITNDDGTSSQYGYSAPASEVNFNAPCEAYNSWPHAGHRPASSSSLPYTQRPLAQYGVVHWGTLPGGADAVFDFGSLQIDFVAGMPNEVIAYIGVLPDVLRDLYLKEIIKHIEGIQKANEAAVEQQRQLQAEGLQEARRLEEEQLRAAAAQQQVQAQQQQQTLAAQQQAQALAAQQLQQQQTQAYAAQQQQAQAQVLAAQQQQQQQNLQQIPKHMAYTPMHAAPAPATARAGESEQDDVQDLLALCLGE